MLYNYFKITIRNLYRHKGYAFINILGLAIGLSACLVILGYVQFERSYDRFHSNSDRIYRLEMNVPAGSEMNVWTSTLTPLGTVLDENFPEIEAVTQLRRNPDALVRSEEVRFYEPYFRYADASFFEVFDFELLRGSDASLAEPGTIFISRSAARRHFGSEDPVGKRLEVSDKYGRNTETYEIVGIIGDTPANSHVHIDFLASKATSMAGVSDPWSTLSFTYFLLGEQHQIEELEAKFSRIESSYLDAHMNEGARLMATPLTNIHLYSEGGGQIEPGGSATYVYLFSLTALLIVILACINYMNLATARSAMRTREVGIRKVVGARRPQLIYQFMCESFLFVMLGLALAIVMAEFTLPAFNAIMNSAIVIDWSDRAFLGAVITGGLGVALAAGSYPALVLSGFTPASVLKSRVRVHTWPLLRKGLVVFQFAVSIGFIAATIIIYQQLNYVQNQRLGFDKAHKLVMETRGALGDRADAFKQALLQQAAVQQVTMSSSLIGAPSAFSSIDGGAIEAYQGNPEGSFTLSHYWVDYDFARTLGLEISRGRFFSESFASDREAFVINETAARAFGWEEPVGKSITWGGKKRIVVGVVNDFHARSMHQEIEPLMLELGNDPTYVTVTIAPSDFARYRTDIEAIWNRFIPDMPFAYSYLEDDIEAMYKSEHRMGQLFIYFAALAIIVACLGLFGLAAFTALQRTKEIGIRKTLGATTLSLVHLLSRDYLKLLGIAFVLASTIAYFAMNRWLEGFAYHVALNGWIFLSAGLLAVVVALLTSSVHSIKAASANPVEALRYE